MALGSRIDMFLGNHTESCMTGLNYSLVCPQVPTSGASQEHHVELEDNDKHGEPTR